MINSNRGHELQVHYEVGVVDDTFIVVEDNKIVRFKVNNNVDNEDYVSMR